MHCFFVFVGCKCSAHACICGGHSSRIPAEKGGDQLKREEKQAMMVSHQDVEGEWKKLKYEHIDWYDIVEAEMSGNSDALSMLRFVASYIHSFI